MADAGTERNGNGNDEQNVRGGNIGGAYQVGVAPAVAAAAAAQNRLENNGNINDINEAQNEENIAARANAIRMAAGRREEEGIRRSAGNWQSGMQQIKWLRRYVRPLQNSRLQMLRHTVNAASQQELEHYKRELRKRPIMISTSNPNSSSVSRGPTHVRGRRIVVGRTRSANTLQSNSNQATYRTRAVREREEQREEIDDDDDDDHSATSVSSDSSDGTLAEDQLSSSSDSSDSQSSVYSDWVNPVSMVLFRGSLLILNSNLFFTSGCGTTNARATETVSSQASQTTFIFTE